jgi:haloacetate dehalogenase
MARDHAERIERLAVLDISPTAIMYARTDKAFATAYYHWFFLIQLYDLPERLIGADPACVDGSPTVVTARSSARP